MAKMRHWPLWICVLAVSAALYGQVDPATAVVGTSQAERSPATGALTGYRPLEGSERAQWYLRETAGAAVSGAVFSTAWGSAFKTPREYPRTWEHTGKRWALSASGSALSNGFEAGLGAIWGEDPRYFRVGGPFKGNFNAKVKNVLLSTVTATNEDGKRMPAYSRYAGQAASNFMQMAWRPESQSSVGDAFVRMGYGFLARMGGNAFREFWPDVRALLKRGKKQTP